MYTGTGVHPSAGSKGGHLVNFGFQYACNSCGGWGHRVECPPVMSASAVGQASGKAEDELTVVSGLPGALAVGGL